MVAFVTQEHFSKVLIEAIVTVLVVVAEAAVTAVKAGITPAWQTSILWRQVIKASSSLAIWGEHHQALSAFVVKETAVGVAPVPLSGAFVQRAGQAATFAAHLEDAVSVVAVEAL